jgi:hypothetical protein
MNNEQPTEEQLTKFWEWCGFKAEYHNADLEGHIGKGHIVTGFWREPDGKTLRRMNMLPALDLNNLFKYAVPRLQDKGNQVELFALEHKGFQATVYKEEFSQNSNGYEPYIEPIKQIRDDNAALALFWAIRKIVND